MTRKPQDVLKQWMQGINEGDVEALLSLYAEEAVVIPTFSNRLLSSPQKVRDYFEKLATHEELSIALHEKTLVVQPLQCNQFTICGIYCWRFAIEGELLSFEARFSYLIDVSLPRPILHHHSSQIPRML